LRLSRKPALQPSRVAIGHPFSQSLNDQGQVAFFAFQNGGSINLFAQGTFTRIARDGDPAPGGGLFSLNFAPNNSGPFINKHGDIVFSANLSTGGAGVFSFSNGNLTRIAGPGDTIPGKGTLTTRNSPSISKSGQIAFAGQTSSGDIAAYLFKNGQLIRVVGKGDEFLEIQSVNFIPFVQINDKGQVAISGGSSNGEGAIVIATPK